MLNATPRPSHQSEFESDFGEFGLSDRTVDRPDESDFGHALLCCLD